jgi:hypothetical protein
LNALLATSSDDQTDAEVNLATPTDFDGDATDEITVEGALNALLATSSDDQTDAEVNLATPTDFDGDATDEITVEGALNALLATSSDDQTDAEVNLATPTDFDGDATDETTVEEALNALAAITGGENLSNTDLTQTSSEDRTYDLNGSDLLFRDNSGLPTTGNIGIGNLTGAPQSQLDVNGQIQARDGFAATDGSVGQPSYGFYTGGDTNTGIYRVAEDQLGFSVGGFEALRLEEVAGTTNVIVNESLQLDNQLLDKDGDSGTAGQILSSTGTQTDWITPTSPFHAASKMTENIQASNALNVDTVNYLGPGNYTVNFTTVASSNDYIIQLTLGTGLGREIQVTSQTAGSFSVQITDSDGFATDSAWFFTVIDL